MASLDSSETQSDAVNELITSAESVCSNRIDLSRRKISEIPDPLFELSRLEHLYLEGNHLTSIPDSLFEKLSNLKWLDLRNNKLHELPASVGKHRALRSLLLEGNEIKELPPELGMVRTLTAIHLADNPLEFPPKNIVQKGTQEILKFLREQIPQEEAKVSPGLTDDEKPEPEQGKAKSAGRIRITKNSMPEPRFTPGSGYLRKQSVESKMQEELINLKQKLFNEKTDAIIQKRKDKQTRESWHAEAKRMQRHKESLARMHGLNYKSPEPPFGRSDQSPQEPTNEHAKQVRDALNAKDRIDITRQEDIVSTIQKHIAKMEQRRRAEKEVSVEEEVEHARRNLEEALKLQRKLEERRALEYRLRAFTADDYFPPKHASSKSSKGNK